MGEKKKKKTIGKITNHRNKWSIKPVTRVKESEKAYNRKKEKAEVRKETGE